MKRLAGVFLVLSWCLAALPSFAAITGIVMTRDGTPVAGATVSLRSFEPTAARRTRLLAGTQEATPLASTKTDTKGRFSIDSPKVPVVDLSIDASGYGSHRRRVEADEETGAIVLQEAEARTGTVTAGGKPVANALVVLAVGGAEYAVRTNAEGRYDAPDPKRLGSITVVHPDYALDLADFAFTRTASAADLHRRLIAGTPFTGRAVAADGTSPVAGATILVDDWPLATSGEDGSFTIARMPAKWTTLAATKDSLVGQVASSKKAPSTIRMAAGGTLSGRVLDSKSRLPVAGAVVRVTASGAARRDAVAAVETDAKGAYSAVVAPGTYMLLTSHPAYSMKDDEASVSGGQRASKDVAVVQLAQVSGTVLDEERRPVVAARVRMADEEVMMASGRFFFPDGDGAVSGPDGRFSMRVDSDRQMSLRANKRGLPQAKSEILRMAAGERKTNVVLTIPSGIAVTGRVTDSEGKPLSGVAVTASEAEQGRTMFVRTIIGALNADDDAVRTASDGTFTMRLKEGTYDFSLRRDGYAPKTVRGKSVAINATEPFEATMDPAVEISGRVVRGGVGVEDVTMFAIGAGQSAATTGPDGSFVLSGLAEGSTRVMIRKPEEFVQEMRTMNAPASGVTIELSSGGRVTGRVVDRGTNKPLSVFQAGISASRGGGGMMMMAPPQLQDFNSEDGTFTLENVPAGAMTLVATAPGYASARLNVNIEEGKTLSDVELGLDAGVRLTGRVTGPTGAPLPDVSVRVMPSTSGTFAMRGNEPAVNTDANGEYTLESLQAGEETVSFSHPKFVTSQKEVTLKGRETRLDVQLSAGEKVTGTVVTEGGAPVPDATVQVSRSGPFGGLSARTNANGMFEIENVPPGRYRFVASKSGLADGTAEDVEVSGGTPVRIMMKTGGTIYGRITGLPAKELAEVVVNARSGNSFQSGRVDSNGQYRIEGAPTGTVQVSAMISGMRGSGGRSSSVHTVELAPGGSEMVDIAFRGDITIRGRVTRNNEPMKNATVLFAPRNTTQTQASANASTDDSGSYTITGIEEGEYTVQVIDMLRLSPYSTTYTVRGSDTFDITYDAAAIRGRVVDAATGEALSGVSVNLRSATSGSERVIIPRGTVTDHNGVFVIDGVSPGSYTVTAAKDGYGTQVSDLSVGDRGIDDYPIKMSPNDGLTLKVVDGRDGRPVTASIFVYDGQGRVVYESRSFFSNPDAGDVKLPLSPGTYSASIVASGYGSRNIALRSPGNEVVPLTPGGTLQIRSQHSVRRRYRLIDASGLPYPRLSTMPASRDLLPSPGTTTAMNIAAGSYTLQLLDENDNVVEAKQVTVEEGRAVRVDL